MVSRWHERRETDKRSLIPHVPSGADEEGGQALAQGQGVDGAVEVDAEQEGVGVDAVAGLGRVDDAVAQAGDEVSVGRGEDGLLEDARDGLAGVLFCVQGGAPVSAPRTGEGQGG